MDGRLLALVVLALSAGCGSLIGSDDASGTVTPAPVATPDQPGSDSKHRIAPGVSPAGIGDVNVLISAHISVASNTEYAWTDQYREAVVDDNDSYRVTRTRRVAFDRSGQASRYHSVQRQEVSGDKRYVTVIERYGNESVGYTMALTANRSRVTFERTRQPPDGTTLTLPNRPIRHLLVLENQTVTRVDRGDRPHFAIRGTRAAIPDHGVVDSFSTRAIVREDGLIRRVNVSYVTHVYGDPVPVRYTFALTKTGEVSVVTPEWVSTARERTAGS